MGTYNFEAPILANQLVQVLRLTVFLFPAQQNLGLKFYIVMITFLLLVHFFRRLVFTNEPAKLFMISAENVAHACFLNILYFLWKDLFTNYDFTIAFKTLV